ncbi:calcium-binding protein [Nostoc sp. FACHB-892]
MALILGTELNDQLQGTSNNDSLFGFGGNDYLVGSGGNDFLDGATGDDSSFFDGGGLSRGLYGGDGNDIILGRDGNDALFGSRGSDILNGGCGDDIIDGIGEVFRGVGYNPSQYGSQDIDVLTGGSGADSFILQGSNGRSPIGASHRWFGNDDYSLITDFNPCDGDVIRLATNVESNGLTIEGQYILGTTPEGLPAGTAIYANNIGTQPELVAILRGISPGTLSLTQPYFVLGTFNE